MPRLQRLSVACLLVIPMFRTEAAEYTFRHFAGAPPSVAAVAPLDAPNDVAVDAAGNVYIADAYNYVIRKMSIDGALTVLAGAMGSRGSADGLASAARFGWIEQLVIAPDGTLYVADGSDTIRKVTPAGEVTTIAGQPGVSGSADGIGTAATFSGPSGLALDASGNLYVADTGNHTIRKITPSGAVTTLAGTAGREGGADGSGSAARFSYPRGLTIDTAGNLYVADPGNEEIRRITPAGVVTTFAGSLEGAVDGRGTAARFDAPRDIVFDRATATFYVIDHGNETLRRISASGDVTTLAGSTGVSGAADGLGSEARFNGPWGLGIDTQGNVYVADRGNDAIRKVTPQGRVSTLGTLAAREGHADGNASNARFDSPSGVAVDRLGNIFVADTDNHTIRKISPWGEVTTFAGSPGQGGHADGTGAAARFYYPEDVAIDASGNLFVADNLNHAVRGITPDGAVTTYAGAPFSGSQDGVGSAARFRFPTGVAVDALGNVYVADEGNNTVRMISPSREVTTLAGSAGQAGFMDGFRSAARFDKPSDVAVDAAGNVYVTEWFNHTIRRISTAGDVTTFAGATPAGSADGAGAAARFLALRRVAIDSDGNLFVTDADRIRMISPTGNVVTLGGQHGVEGNRDGRGAGALFDDPHGIAVDESGRLVIADRDNHSIRVGAEAQTRRRAVAR